MRTNKILEDDYRRQEIKYSAVEPEIQRKYSEFYREVSDIGSLCKEENNATNQDLQRVIATEREIYNMLVRGDIDNAGKTKVNDSFKRVVAKPALSQVHPIEPSLMSDNEQNKYEEGNRFVSFQPTRPKPRGNAAEYREVDALRHRIAELEELLRRERHTSNALRQQLEQRGGANNSPDITLLYDQGEVIRQETLRLLKQGKVKNSEMNDLKERIKELEAENSRIKRPYGRY